MRKPKFVIIPIIEFADCNSFSFTINGRSPRNAGTQSATRIPKRKFNTYTTTIDASPPKKFTAMPAATTPASRSVRPTKRLRLTRSANTPPISINATIGTHKHAIAKLRFVFVAPSIDSTPNDIATAVMPLPTLERNRAATNFLKLLLPNNSLNFTIDTDTQTVLHRPMCQHR